MSRTGISAAALTILVAGWLALGSGPQDAAQIQRGKYLVEDVARCVFCHTPHDEQGNEDRTRWLQGGPVWFEPVHKIQDWAYTAPPLAGLPSFTGDQVIRILQTGLSPEGRKLRLPMHPYHMKREDAADIVAYLQSLRPPLR